MCLVVGVVRLHKVFSRVLKSGIEACVCLKTGSSLNSELLEYFDLSEEITKIQEITK